MFSLKKLCIAAFAGIVLQGATSVFAQNIAEIQFNQEGKSPVQRAFLDHNTRLRKGAHFDAELLNADIKRLYQTGVPSGQSTEPTPFSLRPLAAFVELSSIKRSILYWCSGTARNTIRLAKSCSAAVQMMLEQAERKRSMIWCWWPVTGQNWINPNTVPTG